MRRRTALKRGAGVLALSVPIAGCSGGSTDTEDDDSDDSGDDSTPTPSGPTGEVIKNTVDGLEIAGMEVEETDRERFKVVLTVRNTGNQETDAFNYEYELAVYDRDGNEISGRSSGTTAAGATIAPGEEAEITTLTSYEGSKSDIASYEITVGCDGSAVYCG